MTKRFRIGDHVSWNSEAGRVSGTIIAVHTKDFDYKGHTHRATQDDPQYEIKSDVAPNFYPVLSSFLALVLPCWAGAALISRAEPLA